MFEQLATMLEAIANYGAGTTSGLFTYQPQTPEHLKKD